MDKYEYIPVVAVKSTKEVEKSVYRFDVCYVPNGADLSAGDLVLYKHNDDDTQHKGLCVSDVLFVDGPTLDMICRITSTIPQMLPNIIGKITVKLYSNKEVANE